MDDRDVDSRAAAAWSHEEVVLRRGARSGLPIVVAVDSTARGPAVGGCRLWPYPDWRAGLHDALRLSAAMTDKCAIAGLPHGGGKTVLPLPPDLSLGADHRRALLLDLGDAVAALDGRYHVAEDVGVTSEDILVVRERTEHVLGLPTRAGGIGEPAEPTAVGVLAAIHATCGVLWGTTDLAERSFAVHGLGQIGGRLARALVAAGASVTATDIDPGRRKPASDLGIIWASPDDLLDVLADVLVPASLGGLLTSEVASNLRCRAVVGPANNQLADPGVADALLARDITWAPDVVVNAGGVIYTVLREIHHHGHDDAIRRVTRIGDTVDSLLREAARRGVSPSRVAAELAQQGRSRASGLGSLR